METRYYIGLMGGLHLTIKYGPDESDKFQGHDPHSPINVGECWVYPVSAEIAEEWTHDDDD